VLKELLWEIKEAPYLSKMSLAEKLEQPLALIEDGLARLVQMGYLKEDSGVFDCELPCKKCPYAAACGKVPIKTVALTKKGEKVLAAEQA